MDETMKFAYFNAPPHLKKKKKKSQLVSQNKSLYLGINIKK